MEKLSKIEYLGKRNLIVLDFLAASQTIDR